MRAPERFLPARTAVLVVVAILLSACTSGSHRPAAQTSTGSPAAGASPTATAVSAPIPAIEAGLLPWRLGTPISRVTVLPAAPGHLLLAGGASSAGPSNGVYLLDTASGALTPEGSLSQRVQDAAGAVVGGGSVLFGGTASATVATVQTVGPSPGGTVPVTGTLPQPRSGAASVTVGATTYLVGGDAAVLATTDARTFTKVADLPVPVRYPAVAAVGGQIYVFGGEGLTDGQPVSAIQRIDPARRSATRAGQLPMHVTGAAAVTIGTQIYLAGGTTAETQTVTPGAGRTQLPGTWLGPEPPGAGAGATGHTGPTGSIVPTSGGIWAFNPATGAVLPAGQLQVPVSHAGVAVAGGSAWLVGGESSGSLVAAVQVLTPNASFGQAGSPGAGSPYYGTQLLIADRGNDRLLLMDAAMHVTWEYPGPGLSADPLGFYFPDDAFFARHGSVIVSNQEQNDTIVQIAYPTGTVVWSYGHPKTPGAGPGFLHEPDDAYLLPDGQITVADADNCRILVINNDKTLAHQVGTTGTCTHHPPASMGTPNGDTPLADGNLLVSEITGVWVSEYTPTGSLVWTVHLPGVTYPSDPQQVGAGPGNDADHYLEADYAKPGGVVEFTREGQILRTYHVAAGPGMLNHPSLAELLPSGVYLINDDYRHRMVAIDPATGALVWQYGTNDQAGMAPGQLNTPDGFDLLAPDGSTPTHPFTG
ncbi:MAG TPA: hypothetical protein VFW71_00490 [Actinomycetota bacterium]|nr:hypothetical protein [Actinomycetota bacterium]